MGQSWDRHRHSGMRVRERNNGRSQETLCFSVFGFGFGTEGWWHRPHNMEGRKGCVGVCAWTPKSSLGHLWEAALSVGLQQWGTSGRGSEDLSPRAVLLKTSFQE